MKEKFVNYTLPFNALKNHAFAKKPIPTEANTHQATSSYLNAPRAIKIKPINIIINVAQANTVFLFIPIIQFHLLFSDDFIENDYIV